MAEIFAIPRGQVHYLLCDGAIRPLPLPIEICMSLIPTPLSMYVSIGCWIPIAISLFDFLPKLLGFYGRAKFLWIYL